MLCRPRPAVAFMIGEPYDAGRATVAAPAEKMRTYATLLLIVVSCTLLPLAGHAEGIDTEHLFGFVIGASGIAGRLRGLAIQISE